MLGPQVFGMLHDTAGGSCAYGAAFDAIGFNEKIDQNAAKHWPWLSAQTQCPHCDGETSFLFCVSDHLNDVHRWTREEIADWVATVEPQDENPLPELQEDSAVPDTELSAV
jgi:hypothetical protein